MIKSIIRRLAVVFIEALVLGGLLLPWLISAPNTLAVVVGVIITFAWSYSMVLRSISLYDDFTAYLEIRETQKELDK